MRFGYLALPTAGVFGCALVVSYSDYERSEHGTGGAGADAGIESGGFPSGGSGGSDGGGSGGIPCGTSSICVQEAPAGWNGPLALYQGTAGAPACGGGYGIQESDLKRGLDCGVAECGCGACAPPTNVACSPDILTFWSSQSCAGVGTFLGSSTQTGCGPLPAGTVGVNSPSPNTSGTCGPAALLGTNIPAPTWLDDVRLCRSNSGFSGDGCANGTVCASTPEAPFLPTLCIVAAGEVPCPSGEYSTQNLFYSDYVDARACGTCSCGVPKNVSCNAVIDVFEGNGCTSPPLVSVGSGSCQPVSLGVSYFAWKFAPSGGACGPAFSQVSGTCAPSGAMTVCCRT